MHPQPKSWFSRDEVLLYNLSKQDLMNTTMDINNMGKKHDMSQENVKHLPVQAVHIHSHKSSAMVRYLPLSILIK